MPIERFFLAEPFNEGTLAVLKDPEFHHLHRVVRCRLDDIVELINGRGDLAEAKIVKLDKSSAQLEILSLKNAVERVPKIILVQAIPKLPRLDWIIEKGTELGVASVWLFPGERSDKETLSENQMERLRGETIAALKQCGRLTLPTIELKPKLAKWTELPFPAFYGDVNHSAKRIAEWPKISNSENANGVLWFVGPEGGFTPNEIKHLEKLKAQGISIHENILRTDTAAISGLAILAFLRPKS